jgi:uncharacterized protein
MAGTRAARFTSVEWKNAGNTVRGSALVTKKAGAPWFVFSHGFTGHRLGPGYLFVRLSRALADAGFSSLRFDFSGSGESDGRFQDMTIDTMKYDLCSAVRFIRKNHRPSSLILIGHSLGGMIASLCCTEAKPDGMVLLSPVGDPQGMIRRRMAIMEAGPNADGYYENGPHEMALAFLDGLKSANPTTALATYFKGKLLLLQGDKDSSISVHESAIYVHAAEKAGIETVYRVLRNADHNYATVSHFKAICSTVTDWAKERFR